MTTHLQTPITAEEHERLMKTISELEFVEANGRYVHAVANARRLLVEYRERLAASCFVAIASGTLGHEPAADSIKVARIEDRAEAATIMVELHELSTLLELGKTYAITLGHMSREAFDNLPEFQG